MRMKVLKSGIYCIANNVTNKIYIGSSVNLESRIKSHKNSLNKNKHHNNYLQNSWNKYGGASFEFRILERVENELLIKREQYWIDFYNSVDKKIGYNICPVAGNTLGVKLSEEAKKKLSKRNSGCGNPMYGKTHTPEVRKILSDFHTGLKVTDEFRKKLSKLTKGENNGMHGRKHSITAKESIAEKLKKRGGYSGQNNPNFGNEWSIEKRKETSEKLKTSKVMVGDNNPNVKIKSNQYSKITNRVKNKGIKAIPFLAKHFGVCTATINNILKKVNCEN